MPETNRIWKISGNQLKELERSSPEAERDLEDWIEEDISIVSPNLLLIGRQVTTDFGGAIDLLAVDRMGDTVIIELKKDRTPRDVVAQVLDYAAWVNSLNPDMIREIAENYLNRDLDKAFQEKFDFIPNELNRSQKMLIVAIRADDSTERIVKYLSETYGVNINVVNFEFFNDEAGNQFLLRTFVLDPFEVERVSSEGGRRRRPRINKEKFLKACNEKEELFFERLFEVAENKNLKFSWGTTGCTIRIPVNDGEIIAFWCFSPIASFGSLFSVDLGEIKSKVEVINIDEVKERFKDTRLFEDQGETSIKLDFSKNLTENDVEKIIGLLEELINEILEQAR